MRRKGGWFLLILCFLVVVGVFYVQKYPMRDWHAPLLQGVPSHLRRVEVLDAGTTLSLKLEDFGWSIHNQKGDIAIADPQKVDSFLKAIFDLKALNRLPAQESNQEKNLSQFGLAFPRRTLRFFFKGGKNEEIMIGNEAVGSGECFARLGSKGAILIIPTKMLELAFLPFFDWESHQLFPYSWDDLKKISLVSEGAELVLKKDPQGAWQMSKPVAASLNQEAVKSWLAPLFQASFSSRKHLYPFWKEEELWSLPTLKCLSLSTQSGKKLSFELLPSNLHIIDQPSSCLSLYLPGKESMITVPKELAALFAIVPDQLRNHQLFHTPLAEVDAFSLEYNGQSRRWELQKGSDEREVWVEQSGGYPSSQKKEGISSWSQEKMLPLLEELLRTPIEDFLPFSSSYQKLFVTSQEKRKISVKPTNSLSKDLPQSQLQIQSQPKKMILQLYGKTTFQTSPKLLESVTLCLVYPKGANDLPSLVALQSPELARLPMSSIALLEQLFPFFL